MFYTWEDPRALIRKHCEPVVVEEKDEGYKQVHMTTQCVQAATFVKEGTVTLYLHQKYGIILFCSLLRFAGVY